MKTLKQAKILRIYLSNTDKIAHQAAYEYLAYLGKKEGLAGVTVLKGIMGYGASCKVSSERFWSVSEKYPVRMEFVDSKEKIMNFVDQIEPIIDSMPKGCLVTVQDTEILITKKGICQ
ncbi:MAG: DUF190 domain-containing protein [Bacteroidaceae bacterium]